MAGLLIYKSYSRFYSFLISDDTAYKETVKEFTTLSHIKLYFEKGDLTSQQIQDARDKASEIVKRLNQGEKVNAKKELSDYFD